MASRRRREPANGKIGTLLRKAAQGRISDVDIPALAALLNRDEPHPRLVAMCILSDVDWKGIAPESRQAITKALWRAGHPACPELGRAAASIICKIVRMGSGGGDYVQK